MLDACGEILDVWNSGNLGCFWNFVKNMRRYYQLAGFQEDDQLQPSKFNMEAEKKSLEKEVPLGNHHFQVPC